MTHGEFKFRQGECALPVEDGLGLQSQSIGFETAKATQ